MDPLVRPPSAGAAAAGHQEPEKDHLGTAAAGKAVRGGALRAIGHAAGLGLGLLAVPFMIRHLGVVQYGYFITVTSILSIVHGVTEAGLTSLGIREYAVLGPSRGEAVVRNLVGLRFFLMVVGVLVTGAVVALSGAEQVIVVGVFVSGLALLIARTEQTYSIPLSAEMRQGWIAVFELIRQATLTTLILALVVVGADLVAFFWAQVVAAATMVGAVLLLVGRRNSSVLSDRVSLRPAFDLAMWRALGRQTLPFAVASSIGLIYPRAGVILLSYFSSGVQTGLYSAAFRITEVLALLPWLLSAPVFPILARAARDDMERFRHGLQRVFDVSLVVGAWMALSVGVGAPFAISVVAGDGFEGSIDVLRIQAAGLLTFFLVATWGYALLSLHRYSALVVGNIVAAVVAVAGTLALAPELGARGAALATVAAETVLAVIYLGALGGAPAARPRATVAPKVALAVGGGLVPALLVPAPPVVLVLLSTIGYTAVLAAVRGIPTDALRALMGR